jgi:hypothetical protein
VPEEEMSVFALRASGEVVYQEGESGENEGTKEGAEIAVFGGCAFYE